jgi:nitroreductase
VYLKKNTTISPNQIERSRHFILLVFHGSTMGMQNSTDFNEIIRKRKMIREYDSKEVSDEIIRKLIRNAHRAPSAGHTQVQEFIIVKDPAIKKKLRNVAVDQEYVERAGVNCGVF